MSVHRLNVALTASAGFTGAGLIEFLSHVNWSTAIPFLGSLIATSYSWYVSSKAERERRERDKRAADRQELLEDAIIHWKIEQVKAGKIPAEAAATKPA